MATAGGAVPPTPGPGGPRSTQDTIDRALGENRGGLLLCYVFATVLVVCGAFALVWGTVAGSPIQAVAGAATTSLFWPAMQFAWKIRHTNMMIRLLEIPLANARTAREAADALREAFLAAVPGMKE